MLCFTELLLLFVYIGNYDPFQGDMSPGRPLSLYALFNRQLPPVSVEDCAAAAPATAAAAPPSLNFIFFLVNVLSAVVCVVLWKARHTTAYAVARLRKLTRTYTCFSCYIWLACVRLTVYSSSSFSHTLVHPRTFLLLRLSMSNPSGLPRCEATRVVKNDYENHCFRELILH